MSQTDFFDAQLRHHIGVQRLSSGEVKKAITLLGKSDREITGLLKKRAVQGDFTSERYKLMLKDIRTLRKELMVELGKANAADLRALAKAEQQYMKNALQDAIPVKLDFAVADASRLNTLITEIPFTAGTNAARDLGQWWSGLATADGNRIIEAVQLGMVQGETIAQMVGRVTSALDMTKNNATAVVRTAVNHASNSARNEFFKANSDVIEALMWSAMLDGRTTIICASLDGHHTTSDGSPLTDAIPLPHMDDPLQRPPAHVQCRSTMIGVVSIDGVAAKMPDRAYVRDTRTRKWREKDFRAEAKADAGKGWKLLSVKERNAAIAGKRRAWAEANIGKVPAKTSYEEWLRTQPKAFQDGVLGKAKAEAFRSGAPLGSFVERKGGELNLTQLKATMAEPTVKAPSVPWSKELQLSWTKGLPVKTRDAFGLYIDSGSNNYFSAMRQISRGEAPARGLEWLKPYVRDMERALKTAPKYNVPDTPLFRGMALSIDDFEALTGASRIKLDAISSTSLNPDVALGFARSQGNALRHVVMRIDGNRSGVNLANMSSFYDESEVLLRKGLQYRVKGTAYHAATADYPEWWEVLLEEI